MLLTHKQHKPPGFARRKLWNVRRDCPTSVRFEAGKLHHLSPLLSVLRDKLRKAGRSARKDAAAKVRKSDLDLGIGDAGHHLEQLAGHMGWVPLPAEAMLILPGLVFA